MFVAYKLNSPGLNSKLSWERRTFFADLLLSIYQLDEPSCSFLFRRPKHIEYSHTHTHIIHPTSLAADDVSPMNLINQSRKRNACNEITHVA